MIKALIYTIFFFAFFGNSLVDYHIFPKYISILNELSIYTLLILSLILVGKNKKGINLHLLMLYLFLILIACISAFINERFESYAILSLRLVLRFYLFYLALININFDNDDFRLFNKVLMYLFIIQIPAQAVKFYFYGVSELTIGTYAAHGGGVTTALPLLTIGYLISYYYLYKKKTIYLVLSVGFIIYGIIGAKLALLFLYPIAFLALYYLNIAQFKGIRLPGDIYRLAVIAVLTIVVGGVIIKYQARANKERIVGGSIDFSYTLNYAKHYTIQRHPKNEELSAGRLATSKMALVYLWEEGPINLFLGFGPGVLNKYKNIKTYNSRIEKIAGSYGHTGAIFILVEYGGIALLIIFIIHLKLIKNCLILYKKEKDGYWKAFASGSLFLSFVTLFIFTAYNTVTIIGDIIPPVFFYCMAIVFNRLKFLDNQSQLKV